MSRHIFGACPKNLPSPFGRGAGGEGGSAEIVGSRRLFAPLALTLTLSQRERGPICRHALSGIFRPSIAALAIGCLCLATRVAAAQIGPANVSPPAARTASDAKVPPPLPKSAVRSGTEIVTIKFSLFQLPPGRPVGYLFVYPSMPAKPLSLRSLRDKNVPDLEILGDIPFSFFPERPLGGDGEVKNWGGILFTNATLDLSGMKVQCSEKGWTWNGKDRPEPGSGVRLLAEPTIVVPVGVPFRVSIGSEVPIQYFVRSSEGFYGLVSTQEKTGITVSGKANKVEPATIGLEVSVETRFVEKRKPLEGVSLDVGEPIVTGRQVSFGASLKPGVAQGMLSGSEKHGQLLLRIEANPKPQ
jgi:hypothetical protein